MYARIWRLLRKGKFSNMITMSCEHRSVYAAFGVSSVAFNKVSSSSYFLILQYVTKNAVTASVNVDYIRDNY